ncbi:DUF3016 domain-containing protein [Pseudoalteromonas tunicata]|uniref:DUF3016 domain-containing protein n=1 Tax=Pseudoalteromonas tunicata TaxID=314281 RepID=UPI00273E20EC|nr:DUF3016 domain-containing protein [Pseudoalteromonas tunicata]MDP5212783.1 DUF3016 domain-containing protein [Pseudoalteromonas tunicata]
MTGFKKIICALALTTPLITWAGEANVAWGNLKDFRDVRPSNETRGGYHKRIQNQFEQHFASLAEQLPQGYKLGIKITNIDLAGDVNFSGTRELRIVKPIFFPKVEFNYVLTDNSGKLIDKADVSLKDMGFMDKMKLGRDEEFYYEKRIISDWFSGELVKKVN